MRSQRGQQCVQLGFSHSPSVQSCRKWMRKWMRLKKVVVVVVAAAAAAELGQQ